MELRLDGKVAVVTGASRGIGRAIAEAMAAAGARVVLSSRKQADLEKAAADIDGDVAVFAANAGDPDQAGACIDHALEHFGGIDILVNNAATNPYFGPVLGIELAQYDKTFQVNLRGPLVWTQLAWNKAMQEHGGCVINISSVGGLTVEPFLGVYNTTKAGLIHLTRQLAAEMGPQARVNAIAPGLVKTDFARVLWENAGDQMASRLPTKRLGEPQDIAGAAVFLASDAASWITGQTLIVDGGATVSGLR